MKPEPPRIQSAQGLGLLRLGAAPPEGGLAAKPGPAPRLSIPIDASSPADQSFVLGTLDTPAGPIPRVSAALTARDRRDTIKARWGWRRMDHKVVPGLYALGTPDADAPVLVTANYKLSFDRLREALPGRDAWLLVLDTKGVNVWCAAGKGTFGTQELIARIGSVGLSAVVEHRRLILPQLGAPGVAAHEVRKATGFRTTWGPVRAEDLPAFLDAGGKATPPMRRVRFGLWDRAAVVPIELVTGTKHALLLALAFGLLGGLGRGTSYLDGLLHSGVLAAAAVGTALLAGAVLSPLALPWLPGRAFSVKGAFAGLLSALLLVRLVLGLPATPRDWLDGIAWLVLVPAMSSYLAMNFTGASTYTSLSGVRREMRVAVPAQLAAVALGAMLWITARIA